MEVPERRGVTIASSAGLSRATEECPAEDDQEGNGAPREPRGAERMNLGLAAGPLQPLKSLGG